MMANPKLQDSRELLDNLRGHCSKNGVSSFDFGEYNGLGRNNAINGQALAANHGVLAALLGAGFNKASLPTIRNALRLAETASIAKGIEIRPTDSTDFEKFASFVCKKCNVMMSHLRSLQRSSEKKEICFSRTTDVENRQLNHLLDLMSNTITTSPSASPEYCEDDSQDVKHLALEDLIHKSDAETSDESEQVEAPETAEAEEAPESGSNLKEVRLREGKLSGARGGPKSQTKLLKKPAAAKAAPKSAKAEKEEPAGKFRVGKYSNKGYVQFLDKDGKWKLLVNVDYQNCSDEWKHTCHGILDKLLEHVQNNEVTKEELRKMRDELLGVSNSPVASTQSKNKKLKKPAASAAAGAPPVKKRPAAAASSAAADAAASSDENVFDHNLLGSQDGLSPGKMTVALCFSAFGSFK